MVGQWLCTIVRYPNAPPVTQESLELKRETNGRSMILCRPDHSHLRSRGDLLNGPLGIYNFRKVSHAAQKGLESWFHSLGYYLWSASTYNHLSRPLKASIRPHKTLTERHYRSVQSNAGHKEKKTLSECHICDLISPPHTWRYE